MIPWVEAFAFVLLATILLSSHFALVQRLDSIVADQAAALAAIAPVAEASTAIQNAATALNTAVDAFVAAHPPTDYQPILDALAPVSSSLKTASDALVAASAKLVPPAA
jgi:hypothetical protein